jgi:proteasome lid subunit RPN8/RPN11
MKKLVAIAIVLVANCFMTGCQKEDSTGELRKDKISQSKEYEEYMVAHLNFYNELQNITGQKVKIEEVNGKSVYRTTAKSFKIELFNKIFVAHRELIYKYPEYEKLNANEKSKLFDIVSVKSKEIAKLLPIENRPVRLKNGMIENAARYITQFFSNYLDAFMACFNYSTNHNVESGGLVLPNGKALFIIDTAATSTSMSLSGISVALWGSPNTVTFHFHPGGNIYPSSTDSTTMQTMMEYDINTLIILTVDPSDSTNFNTHYYYFEEE